MGATCLFTRLDSSLVNKQVVGGGSLSIPSINTHKDVAGAGHSGVRCRMKSKLTRTFNAFEINIFLYCNIY